MLVIIFFLISVVAIALMRGPLSQRIEVYCKGAGESDLLLMVWIFLLAGGFAATAKTMGAIEAAVDFSLSIMPASMLLPGIFLASCLVSFSIGTSVGTIAALVPVGSAMAASAGLSVPMVVGCVVGGSFFGDNLSFISDTTVVATRTQGVRMKDKFIANFRIVLPAALITLVLYAVLGYLVAPQDPMAGALAREGVSMETVLLVLPYVAVIVLAQCGLHVMAVLLIGNMLCGGVGLLTGRITLAGWSDAVQSGMAGMQETIYVALMAGGLLAVVRHRGIINWIIRQLTRSVTTPRGAELAIAALVSLTNLLTANNTVAILSVGGICRDVAKRYGITMRRSASLLDTFSCITQGLLPYGAQVLIASGLASIPALSIVPTLYYAYVLLSVSLVAIFLRSSVSEG